jgi:tryptophan 7-halogenase
VSSPREALRKVVVAGSGPLGILAAIALRRALPGCDVVVIGQEPNPAAFADWSPGAMPFTNKLHDRLGIAEADIVTKAAGSYRLITRLIGWGGPHHSGVLAYGEGLDPALKTTFARALGTGAPWPEPASLAEALAIEGRFAPPPPGEPTPISEVDYALRWNPLAYRALLIAQAEALGIGYAEGIISAVEPGEDEGLSAIIIAGQGRIEADLFVDCSGPQASLLAALPGFQFADWSKTLPTRTVYLAQAGTPMAALEDRLTLTALGWVSEVAGRDGLQVMLGTGEGVSRTDALALLRAPVKAAVSLTPGRALRPWIGNVVALGDAAARFEPLGPLHLDLAHRQLALLLEMLPGRDIAPHEREEYNRRSELMMEGVHEILAAHFAAPAAQSVFGARALPSALAAVIDQFERRGRIVHREELPLLAGEQFALMAALGMKPGILPAARAGDAAHEARARAAFDAARRAALGFAPPYADWLARVLQA